MKNRILSLSRGSIPYVKELRSLAKSVVGCVVMQQLDYWFDKYPDGFYKFLEPCGSPGYKRGQSWGEEIGCSAEEFVTAFEKFGVRYKSKTAFESAADKFQGLYYCCYFDRGTGLTHYLRNHELLDAELDKLATRETGHLGFRKPTSPVSGNRQPRITETGDVGLDIEDSETTEETTEVSLSPRARKAAEIYAEVYGQYPHGVGQEEIEAEGIDDPTVWREVVRQAHANLTPWMNVGTVVKMYRAEMQRRPNARASPRPLPPTESAAAKSKRLEEEMRAKQRRTA